MKRQIIALGGGGFSMEASPVLDDYILSRARCEQPRICFLPTASGESLPYIVRFYRAFCERDCIAYDVTLGGLLPRQPATTPALAEFLAAQDIIYVGGGNTANMLALWRVHGIDRALRAAWEGGTLLCGVSAGMICWFQSSLTDSFGDLDPLLDGLGLIPTSACPHFDGEPRRRPRYHELVASGVLPAGYACDDGAAIVFEDDRVAEVVSSRREAAAYRVDRDGDRAIETRLPARYLGQ